ncbi:hypothetical protein [Pleionea sediminis]|uniref:hypothetical protein n=1 Tax=Pleionea sediminis TaxID=2569479 RepID=UPI00118528FF|nr:hypothetical protein [Pleionea sediminis]
MLKLFKKIVIIVSLGGLGVMFAIGYRNIPVWLQSQNFTEYQSPYIAFPLLAAIGLFVGFLFKLSRSAKEKKFEKELYKHVKEQKIRK